MLLLVYTRYTERLTPALSGPHYLRPRPFLPDPFFFPPPPPPPPAPPVQSSSSSSTFAARTLTSRPSGPSSLTVYRPLRAGGDPVTGLGILLGEAEVDGGAARPVEGRGVEAAEDHALAEEGVELLDVVVEALQVAGRVRVSPRATAISYSRQASA